MHVGAGRLPSALVEVLPGFGSGDQDGRQ
ncbi:hypothetical protein OOU_Y34scaffold00528g39 [Pyricularia oryzae Y34]|uniref:Uncharacterized protein n=2 Tax=Pyricularia oryzae TaxID=318829 RepID=A0AA97PL74_PYRO3|nr:hypothetical protein OOU_Y34scaffold00528g39 [Pyricularia oryzae Y34]